MHNLAEHRGKKKRKLALILPLIILFKMLNLKLMLTNVIVGIGVIQLLIVAGGSLLYYYLKHNTHCKIHAHPVHTHSHVVEPEPGKTLHWFYYVLQIFLKFLVQSHIPVILDIIIIIIMIIHPIIALITRTGQLTAHTVHLIIIWSQRIQHLYNECTKDSLINYFFLIKFFIICVCRGADPTCEFCCSACYICFFKMLWLNIFAGNKTQSEYFTVRRIVRSHYTLLWQSVSSKS